MAALSAKRNTPKMGDFGSFTLAVAQKGATTVHQGGLVAMNGAFGTPGSTVTARKTVGVAKETSVNAGADGAVTFEVEGGIFKFGNSAAGDAITDADIGADCYVVDDQTVAKTDGTGTRSKAGRIIKVESDGVWTLVGPAFA